jgi:hypothetical protein
MSCTVFQTQIIILPARQQQQFSLSTSKEHLNESISQNFAITEPFLITKNNTSAEAEWTSNRP